MRAPNLYEYFGVSREENSTALGVLLAGRDAQLAMQGLAESESVRREAMIGYSVLGDDARRKLYDEALDSGRVVSWAQLEHLGTFEDWPQDYTGWTEPDPEPIQQPQGYAGYPQQAQGFAGYPQQPQPSAYGQQYSPHSPLQYPHSAYAQNRSPYANPFDPLQDPRANASYPVLGHPTGVVNYAEQSQRPTASKRVGMAVLDAFFVQFLIGFVTVSTGVGSSEFLTALSALMALIVLIAYFVVPEAKWGGSPAKLLLGYEVRKVDTHERLTYSEAAKRNWFRLVNIVPGLGQMASFIGAISAISTVTPENGLRGAHDRFANAEVVKRQ